jgi:3-oxoacyl-[acyl-carrier protein] reductase
LVAKDAVPAALGAEMGYFSDPMPTQRKTALVTGASRGIGRGIALELAKRGWNILINYAGNHEAARECAALCKSLSPPGSSAWFDPLQADISSAQERARIMESLENRYGWIDLLVNNAGVAPRVRADILEAGEDSFDNLIAVNVKGPYFLSQAISNFWISRLEGRNDESRPKMIIVSSISAYTASVNRGDYCISKAALGMMTALFAARLAEYGIGVFEIRPGIVATDMTSGVKEKYDRMISEGLTPFRRWGQPSDVGLAVTAIAEDLFPFSTGEVINVDGGFHLRRL